MTIPTTPHGVDYYLLDAAGSPIKTPTSPKSGQIPEYIHHHSPDPGNLITMLATAGMGTELPAPDEPDSASFKDELDFTTADIAWRADTLGVTGIALHKIRGGEQAGGPHWWITPAECAQAVTAWQTISANDRAEPTFAGEFATFVALLEHAAQTGGIGVHTRVRPPK